MNKNPERNASSFEAINIDPDMRRTLLDSELKTSKPPKPSLSEKLRNRLRVFIFTYLHRKYPENWVRRISLSGKTSNTLPFSNRISNTKYSIVTFLPVILFNQFKLFFNLFFLLTALSQFIPLLQVGYLFAYMTPLCFVLFITIVKETVEDVMRYKRDAEINNQKYKVLTDSAHYVLKRSQELMVGDIVEIQQNTRVPADLVVLYTNSPSDSVFIRTDQLDGETDWKLRFPVDSLQKSLKGTALYKNLRSFNGTVETGSPNELIYEFKGAFVNENTGQRESLSLENCLWSNTVLATNKILGLVVFAGKETKMQMAAKKPLVKFGRIDREINVLSVFLFLLMVVISLLIVVLSGMKFNWLFVAMFFRFVLLLSSIIPISMKVNLEIAKLVYCFKIDRDASINGTIARNMNIPEELGRIHYIMTDKTGTLTKNEMIFRKLQLPHRLYSYPDHKSELQKQVKKAFLSLDESFSSSDGMKSDVSIDLKSIPLEGKKHQKLSTLKEAMLAMSICHNVTPISESLDDDSDSARFTEHDSSKSYQASSPDEIALVKTASELGVSLGYRDQRSLVILKPSGKEDSYKILKLFPFSSESKRMGIIVRHGESKKVTFFLKGADAVIQRMLIPSQSSFVQEQCDDLAREGLRTLVFAAKTLSEAEYEHFSQQYNAANSAIIDREVLLNKAMELIERNLDLVAITGVEDLLQDNVAATVENLRQAGIRVWMITGDKVATAICVAISAGLYRPAISQLLVMKELKGEEEALDLLKDFEGKLGESVVLVIDGMSLQVVLASPGLEKEFMAIALKVGNVICCRCSPSEKAVLTEKVKKHTGKVVMAVGDGGNDVGMIQVADVGVGIEGKEGRQAALAADFSIERFENLNKLIFWHGRLSYKRSAILSQFIIHRGLIISFIQAIFSLVFYFVAISIFNGTLLLGYSTIYTVLPVFCLVLDEDLTVETALSYPALYKTLSRSRDLNAKSFLVWVFYSLYQGLIIMWLSLYVFDNAFLNIVTITFSCLILIEFLNLYTVLNRIHALMIAAQCISVVLYFISIWCLRSIMDVSYITWGFIGKVVAITAISFVPIYVGNRVRRKLWPNDFEKVMKNVKVERINTSLAN